MLIYDHPEQLIGLNKPVYWALGFFDGVHRGHRKVIRAAHSPGALRGVLTFDRHPLTLLRPESAPLLLTPDAAQKAELIEKEGQADVLLRWPFTAELAGMEPLAFLDALSAACRIAGISVGANWRFGRGGSGSPELLCREGEIRGFPVKVQDLEEVEGMPVSSSRARIELAAGHLERVELLLGRRYSIIGTVEHGQHLARRLGFPTANVHMTAGAALPPFGVYSVRCLLGAEPRIGIANLGMRPTIKESTKEVRLEVHLPGWQGDLYGQRLEVELMHFVRPERSFPSIEALQRQMQRDIAAVMAEFS